MTKFTPVLYFAGLIIFKCLLRKHITGIKTSYINTHTCFILECIISVYGSAVLSILIHIFNVFLMVRSSIGFHVLCKRTLFKHNYTYKMYD